MKQEGDLRTYFQENHVSLELSLRVKQFFQAEHETGGRSIHECDMPFLKSLPSTLLAELRQAVYYPKVSFHPLFNFIFQSDVKVFLKMCHLTMKQSFCVAEQDVFVLDDVCKCMYFVVQGVLDYHSPLTEMTAIKKKRLDLRVGHLGRSLGTSWSIDRTHRS